MFLATTPANRPDSPEYMPRGGGEAQFAANQMSLHDEQVAEPGDIAEEDE